MCKKVRCCTFIFSTTHTHTHTKTMPTDEAADPIFFAAPAELEQEWDVPFMSDPAFRLRAAVAETASLKAKAAKLSVSETTEWYGMQTRMQTSKYSKTFPFQRRGCVLHAVCCMPPLLPMISFSAQLHEPEAEAAAASCKCVCATRTHANARDQKRKGERAARRMISLPCVLSLSIYIFGGQVLTFVRLRVGCRTPI